MALDYNLGIATDWSAARVAWLVRETALAHDMIGPSNTLDVVGKGDSIALGMRTWVVGSRPAFVHPVITEIGLAPPTAALVFSVSKREDILAQQDAMVQIVAGVLAAVPGDAFLGIDYETFWLVRRGDDLGLHEDDRIWTTERQLMIMQPFRRATFAIP